MSASVAVEVQLRRRLGHAPPHRGASPHRSLPRQQPAKAAAARARLDQLTPRERDVLALLAQGETNADIATHLDMRESTVKAHVSRILTALGVTNRVQAALLALDAGLTT
ncbi:response regulator transcription factor [Microbispora sitophila]|uniref:response regulator transcription factor n=1 Tax=Microbispora sitophila TaxID=2771537 RepID=UPI001D02D89B|nr:LuxR C-terminal-related transcriptional regulator [Microbispora sitophila]